MISIAELTSRINERGVRIDVKALKLEIDKLRARLNSVHDSLVKSVSLALNIPASEVNLNSSKLMVEFFYGYHDIPILQYTKSGKTPSLSAEFLEPFSSFNPDVKNYISYRSLSKNLNILSNILKDLRKDGCVYSCFNCSGAKSGRFTSVGPNLQQIPKPFRKFFIARKGFKLLSIDIKQAEFQLANHLAGVNFVGDFHQKLADDLSIDRDSAKTINNAILYGVTSFGLKNFLGCSKAEADRLLKFWHLLNPELSKYIREVTEKAKKDLSVSIYDGSLSVPLAASSFSAFGGNLAFNIHVQGSLAKLLKIAMLNIQNLLDAESPNSHIILTVHDELVIEISENSLHLIPLIVTMMENIQGFAFKTEYNLNDYWI